MDKSLIKEEMMMEYNTELTEEEIQIVVTQAAIAIIGNVLVLIVLSVLAYKFFKK